MDKPLSDLEHNMEKALGQMHERPVSAVYARMPGCFGTRLLDNQVIIGAKLDESLRLQREILDRLPQEVPTPPQFGAVSNSAAISNVTQCHAIIDGERCGLINHHKGDHSA